MKLDTPSGLFTAHVYLSTPHEQRLHERLIADLRREQGRPRREQSPAGIRHLKADLASWSREDLRRAVTVTLHRGTECKREPQGPGDPGGCRADSAVAAEISAWGDRPFRLASMRAAALGKAMLRLGLSKEERVGLWQAYLSQVAVIPRRCVAVITTCPAGHKHRVEAVHAADLSATHDGRAFFPSAREFCGATTNFGLGPACEQPTIISKHRYLYAVELPKGRRQKRREAALERARAGVAAVPISDESDIPF